jgi:hypothetical protein
MNRRAMMGLTVTGAAGLLFWRMERPAAEPGTPPVAEPAGSVKSVSLATA